MLIHLQRTEGYHGVSKVMGTLILEEEIEPSWLASMGLQLGVEFRLLFIRWPDEENLVSTITFRRKEESDISDPLGILFPDRSDPTFICSQGLLRVLMKETSVTLPLGEPIAEESSSEEMHYHISDEVLPAEN